jgi:hypothetical protein
MLLPGGCGRNGQSFFIEVNQHGAAAEELVESCASVF